MREAISVFPSEQSKKLYVDAVEARFENELDLAVAKILRNRIPRIILLSGPTCSGKTTMANKLVSELFERGEHTQVISIDDFFHSRTILAELAREKGIDIDFDSPSVIDHSELARCVSEILAGGTVTVPIFDFKKGCRTGTRTIDSDEHSVFLFEGIQAVYPEVTALFQGQNFCRIFVSPEEELSLGKKVFSPDEIRFFRRIVRDHRFRGATPEFTFFLWDSVRRNEVENIFPYASSCEVRLNTVIDYEISMLRPHLIPLLSEIKKESAYYTAACNMLYSLENIDNIDESYLPPHSMYHEFLG